MVDGIGRLSWELLATAIASIPLGLSVWAILDIAHRPAWAWGLARRSRVAWLAAVLLGVLCLLPGMVISTVYLVRIRREIADAEAGRFPTGP